MQNPPNATKNKSRGEAIATIPALFDTRAELTSQTSMEEAGLKSEHVELIQSRVMS